MAIDKLKQHLHQHKDAMVILGSNSTNELLKSINEDKYSELINKKTLRRKEESFWKYFLDEVYLDPKKTDLLEVQELVKVLRDLSLVDTIVCQGQDGLLSGKGINDIINLKGTVSELICQNTDCLKVHSFDDSNDFRCKICDTQLRPNMIFPGENYDDETFHDIKQSLIDTHTLIVIDLDTKEQAMLDLIADFGEVKETSVSEKDKKQLVVIHREDLELDFNEIAFCDFLVRDESSKAMKRLVKGIK